MVKHEHLARVYIEKQLKSSAVECKTTCLNGSELHYFTPQKMC